jgi:predicted ester cyclase
MPAKKKKPARKKIQPRKKAQPSPKELEEGGQPMSIEENKANARRVVEEGINQNNVDSIAGIFVTDYIEHQPQAPGTPTGLEGFKHFLTTFRAAFPDFHYTVDDTIAEGDTVVQRLTGYGTMHGSLAGMPPTGQAAAWSEIHISRFKEGKIVEHWGLVDQLGMMQQLGLGPAPGQPPP